MLANHSSRTRHSWAINSLPSLPFSQERPDPLCIERAPSPALCICSFLFPLLLADIKLVPFSTFRHLQFSSNQATVGGHH